MAPRAHEASCGQGKRRAGPDSEPGLAGLLVSADCLALSHGELEVKLYAKKCPPVSDSPLSLVPVPLAHVLIFLNRGPMKQTPLCSALRSVQWRSLTARAGPGAGRPSTGPAGRSLPVVTAVGPSPGPGPGPGPLTPTDATRTRTRGPLCSVLHTARHVAPMGAAGLERHHDRNRATFGPGASSFRRCHAGPSSVAEGAGFAMLPRSPTCRPSMRRSKFAEI